MRRSFVFKFLFHFIICTFDFYYNSNLEEMLERKPFCRYRSIKYSTSQQKLLQKKTIEQYGRRYSRQRLSQGKETLELQSQKKQKNQKISSCFRIKQYDKENIPTLSRKCSRLLRSKHTSLFEAKQSEIEHVTKEDQIEIISIPRYDQFHPFTNYYQHLQEITDTFDPVIKKEHEQTNKIRGQLKIFGQRISNQIQESQKQGKILLASLHLKISKTFKQHSKQIITTRKTLIQLKQQLSTLNEKIILTEQTLSDMSKSFTS